MPKPHKRNRNGPKYAVVGDILPRWGAAVLALTGFRLAGRFRVGLRWWLVLVRGGWFRRRSRRGVACGRGRRFSCRRFRRAEILVYGRCAGGPWRLRRNWPRLLLRRLRCGGRGRRGHGVRGLRG